MVRKKMYKRIQKLKRNGYGKIKITAMLGLDPATVRKYYYMRPALRTCNRPGINHGSLGELWRYHIYGKVFLFYPGNGIKDVCLP